MLLIKDIYLMIMCFWFSVILPRRIIFTAYFWWSPSFVASKTYEVAPLPMQRHSLYGPTFLSGSVILTVIVIVFMFLIMFCLYIMSYPKYG